MEKQIDLYECPKCRQLRLENTYVKNGVYYSTCKPCRENKGIEENYINKNSYMLAILSGSEYTSNNKKSVTNVNTTDHADLHKKTTLINAIISRLPIDSATLPTTLDNNHKFMNMLTKLSNMDTTNINFSELKALLEKPFKYNVAKNTLDDSRIVLELHTASNQKHLGVGMNIQEYAQYNLSISGSKSKKAMRKSFQGKKKTLLKELLSENGPVCYLCGTHMEENDITIDHVHPISCGGTNDIENLQLACTNCNMLKGSKTLAEYKGLKPKEINPVILKKDDLKAENEIIKRNCTFANEQIAYYTQIQKNLLSRRNKNIVKLDTIAEYEKLSKRMKELEESIF